MMNTKAQRSFFCILPGLLALCAVACVPDKDASIGKTDETKNALTAASCESKGGIPTPDPGDGSLLKNGCENGAETLGTIDEEGWREGGLCCSKPKDANPSYSVAQCEAKGGVPTTDPGDGSLFQDGCPDGASTLGTINEPSWIEGGLCCEKPAGAATSYSVSECEASGGVATADPGDGSLTSCPDGQTTLGTINQDGWREGGLCCKPEKPAKSYSADECTAAGGTPTTDPGDGSLFAQGCPTPQKSLGPINEPSWIEGGLCCKAP